MEQYLHIAYIFLFSLILSNNSIAQCTNDPNPIILNSSFEDHSCCNGLGMVGCADNWHNYNDATPDYYNAEDLLLDQYQFQ